MKKIILLLFVFISININAQKVTIQPTALTSGTITTQDTQQDLVLIHDAGVTASLTIPFPATPISGQMFCVASVGGITSVTMTSTATIVAGLTTLAVGGNGTWVYNGTKWIKIK